VINTVNCDGWKVSWMINGEEKMVKIIKIRLDFDNFYKNQNTGQNTRAVSQIQIIVIKTPKIIKCERTNDEYHEFYKKAILI
jgi:hypothetical protein